MLTPRQLLYGGIASPFYIKAAGNSKKGIFHGEKPDNYASSILLNISYYIIQKSSLLQVCINVLIVYSSNQDFGVLPSDFAGVSGACINLEIFAPENGVANYWTRINYWKGDNLERVKSRDPE